MLGNMMTFAEGNEYLGRGKTYLLDMIKAGKLKEDIHYRQAKGNKLILVSVVEAIKNGTHEVSEKYIIINDEPLSADKAKEVLEECLSKEESVFINGVYIDYIGLFIDTSVDEFMGIHFRTNDIQNSTRFFINYGEALKIEKSLAGLKIEKVQ